MTESNMRRLAGWLGRVDTDPSDAASTRRAVGRGGWSTVVACIAMLLAGIMRVTRSPGEPWGVAVGAVLIALAGVVLVGVVRNRVKARRYDSDGE